MADVGAWGLAVVRGQSMEPTLRDGDRLLVRYGAPVRPGLLVLAKLPGRPLAVKRAVLRDGHGWWVERDNPHVGVDSWLLGTVPESDIRAVVVRRVWPLVRRRRRGRVAR
jgi:hypothetical protein